MQFFFSDVLNHNKMNEITGKQICEDQIVTFKQSHILLYQGLLLLTRSTCVIVDARSHTCKSHDFIPRYDIKGLITNYWSTHWIMQSSVLMTWSKITAYFIQNKTRTTRTPAFWGYPPAASWLPILLSHIGSQVKRRQSQSNKFKEFAKISNYLNF